MTILGLDYGEKKIGVAKSAGSLAVTFCIIQNDKVLFQKIKEICEQQNIEKIVVGVPYPHSGNASDQQKKSEQFVKDLKQELSIDVVAEDERMSSQMAQKLGVGLKRGEEDDAIAAMLVLQSYLDKHT
ncbi:MAG: hypothetical protein US74_C0009G0026 [Parcubacteria group bacterium GW2011_GWA2_38_13]|nr:MAG: hypothetical protein US74_C0009G0026 [Parcubacteria group bacterium GW2011_GWA2_38_13]